MISDQATYVNLGSYGPFNGLTPVVDKGPLPALQLVPRVIPTSPVINLTAVDGAITAAVIVTGGTGITSSIVYPHGDTSYDWYWPVLGDDCVTSGGSNGVVSVRVVGGVVTAVNVVAGGSGYAAAPVWTPKLGTDPFTLQPYQWYEELLVNYVSTVAQNCIECKPVRLNPGSPPGKSNYLIVDGSQASSIYFGSTANRFMFPRTTSRQTGAGNANKKGRHKVGI